VDAVHFSLSLDYYGLLRRAKPDQTDLSMCMYVCVYVCMYIFMYSFAHEFMHSCTPICIRSYDHTLIQLTHSYTHALIHSYTYILIPAYTHTLIHSCTHTPIHSYTHTTHTLTQSFTHTLIVSEVAPKSIDFARIIRKYIQPFAHSHPLVAFHYLYLLRCVYVCMYVCMHACIWLCMHLVCELYECMIV